MTKQVITLLSHGVAVHDPCPHLANQLVNKINSTLYEPVLEKNYNQWVVGNGRPYFYIDKQANTYYYHREFLENIKMCIQASQDAGRVTNVEYIEAGLSEGVDVVYKNYKFDLRVNDEESRFFFQNEVSDTAVKPENTQTIFEIQTGRGKTKTFQKVQVRLGKRTVIIVRPAYVKKWKYDCVDDEGGLYEPSPRVRVVSGVAGIDNVLRDGIDGELDRKNISTILIPTTSLMLWLEEYSNRPHRDGIELSKFYEYLGAGLVGYDEIHEHFLTVYLSGVILNPPKLVEMSATLKPSAKKEFHRLRYAERFPMHNRVDVPYIRVCDIAFIYYSILVNKMRNRVNGMSMYNHKTFEAYLYQHCMIDDYFDMIYDLMQRAYFAKYQKGQRVLVFFSMIQTCTDFTEYLKRRVKEDGFGDFDIVRYVDKDKFEDLQACDIGVSSPEKAGTAIDLPGLVLALVTPAISDRQKNEQIAGRPRTVTQWENVTPKVLFMHCRELKKHNAYLNERMASLAHVAKSMDVINGGYQIEGKETVNYKLSPETNGGKTPVKTKAKQALNKFRRKQQKQQWKDRKNKVRNKHRSNKRGR